jgi:hypothetical protein
MRVVVDLSDGSVIEADRDEVCDEDHADSTGEWVTLWRLDGETQWHEWEWGNGKPWPVAWRPATIEAKD